MRGKEGRRVRKGVKAEGRAVAGRKGEKERLKELRKEEILRGKKGGRRERKEGKAERRAVGGRKGEEGRMKERYMKKGGEK